MSDVALHAGVSHQTVSRVLNGHPSVRAETRDRVLESIATLGYRRNSAARALVTRRSDTLGVVTPATALHGPTSTLVGFEEAARVAGWYVSVATVRQVDAESMRRTAEHFLDQGVDGIVVIAPTNEIAQAVAGLDSPVPIVMISSTPDVPPGPPRARGRRRPAPGRAPGHPPPARPGRHRCCTSPDRRTGSTPRTAWPAGTTSASPPASSSSAPVVTGWRADDGYAIGRRLVDERPPERDLRRERPARARARARVLGGRRPGRPRTWRSSASTTRQARPHYAPPLTTVRQDFAELGRLATSVMQAALDGGPSERHVLPPELVVRASSLRHA